MKEKNNHKKSTHNFKEDVCPICKGTGFIDKGSKVELCKCRFEGQEICKLLHIPKRFYHANFTNYYPQSPSQYEALAECIQYSKNFDLESGKGLSIVGPSGVGKTHLACAVLKEIYLKRGIKGLFFDTRDMLSKIRYYFDEPAKQKKLLNILLNVPILVLDDLGNEALFDWSREYVTYILTYRYNNLKSTILTTTYSLDVEKSPSLAERFSDSLVNKINQMNALVLIKKN